MLQAALALPPGEPTPGLVLQISEGYRRGQSIWPTVQLSPIGFAHHVLAVTAGSTHLALAIAGLRLDDLFLAAACNAGDVAALRAFEAAYFSEIRRAFQSAAREGAFLDDIEQNLREKLFVRHAGRPAEIASYAGRGSLRTWFRIVLYHHTLNFKAKQRHQRSESLQPLDLAEGVVHDPELLYLRERYASDFRSAAADAVTRLDDTERAFLHHHYIERLTIDQLAMIYGIHRVTAARRITKGREALVAMIRHALQTRLRVEAGELDSILRLVPSELSLSWSRILRPSSAVPARR